METRTVFFIGKPGCGKGTQAKLLAEATGWPIKVASDGLREIIAGGGVVGRKLKETMDAGLLVPSWLPGYIFIKWLRELNEDKSIIFDGFNRKVPEAELIADALAWVGRSMMVIDLAVSDESIKRRLALRREAEGRVDDHDHVIEKRLVEYRANTEPVKEFFRTKGVLVEVDGEPSPAEITADIKAKLGLSADKSGSNDD